MKNLDECKLAYQKPASTIHSIISDIHSALATSSNSIDPSINDNAELLYADRKIHRPRTFPGRPNNNNQRSNKRCNVCFRFGCWSTNHTKAERDRAYKLNNSIRQFISEIDDEAADNNSVNDGMQELITLIQLSDNYGTDDDLDQSESKTNLQSTNLFLEMSNINDDDPAISYIAHNENNASAYALTSSPPV